MPERPFQRKAAAIRYAPGDDAAPKLVAKGTNFMADRILELAETAGIPVREDPSLLAVLAALDVGTEIPPDLYELIAEVLAWAYKSDHHAARVAADR